MTLLRYDGICQAKLLIIIEKNEKCEDFCVMFEGEFITATRQGDGLPRLNFKKLKMGEGFSLERYALGVYNEICMALGGHGREIGTSVMSVLQLQLLQLIFRSSLNL